MTPECIKEKQAGRKKSAVIGVGVFVLIQLLSAAALGAVCLIPDAPGWLVVLFAVMAVLCLVTIIPALMLLKERFKEIEGGELDAAAEY